MRRNHTQSQRSYSLSPSSSINKTCLCFFGGLDCIFIGWLILMFNVQLFNVALWKNDLITGSHGFIDSFSIDGGMAFSVIVL